MWVEKGFVERGFGSKLCYMLWHTMFKVEVRLSYPLPAPQLWRRLMETINKPLQKYLRVCRHNSLKSEFHLQMCKKILCFSFQEAKTCAFEWQTVLLVVKIKDAGFSQREKLASWWYFLCFPKLITWIPTQRHWLMILKLELELGVTGSGKQMH